MLWEHEVELKSGAAHRAVAEFLEALRNGLREKWSRDYFGDDYPCVQSDAEVIGDIYGKAFGEKGRCLYRCPTCGSLYLQRQFFVNEWECFEKAG